MPQYQGVWTLQQQMQALTSGQWATDPNFKNTTLLLQADNAANSAQNNTFLDSSTNSFTITRNGNTTQGSFTPFSNQSGAWSNYFNGSSNLNATSNAAYNASTGDFCVEAWVYNTTAASALQVYVLCVGGISLYRTAAGYLEFAKDSVAAYATSTTLVPINQWSHVAVTRSGTTLRLFIDGVQAASVTNSVSFPAGNLAIGSTYAGASYHTGYLSNVRYVVGSPVYTTNFTPSPLPLTAITNTVLLTCQSYRFVDNSTTANTLSLGSTPQVQPFSPFAPQYQWTSDVIGGSGYFDGTGDFLNTPTSANLAMGSGDFTIECWVYTPLTGARYIFDIRPSASQALGAYVSSSSLYINSGSTLDILASSAFVLNAWNHFAYVRSGSGSNNISIYLNGSRVYQRTDTTNYSTSPIVYIAADNSGSYSNGGYISGFRILKGTAQYSGTTLTVPTSPPTAVANTQLLLNFTNAGIYDGTMKNNLETVGDAQVSTSVVKYGSGSMYFNGTTGYLKPYYPAPTNGTNFSFGTGDFTVEFWMYPTSAPSNGMIMDGRGSGASGDMWLINWVSGVISWYAGAALISSSTVSTNTWTHVAICRSGTSTKMFLNGTQTGSTYTDTKNYTVGNGWPTIGASYNAIDFFTGYLDDIRVTKGIARYTQNFIPPSVALPRQ